MYNDKLVENIHTSLLPYLKNKSKVLISISGGIDSIVLLDAIFKIKPMYNLKIELFHVNFNMHDNSNYAEEHCKSLANKYK